MSLPAILEGLAALLPERVRVFHNDTDPTDVWVTHVEVKYEGWRDVWWGGDMPRWNQAWALEGMLREECDTRGWDWGLTRDTEGYSRHKYRAYVQFTEGKSRKYAEAPVPVEALASALLAALSVEKGEG